MDDYSIVETFDSTTDGRKCGYCKSTDGSLSYGMWGHSLTVKNYQDLIDRGWRRSGKYCYKPLMKQTCCPQYTIKCSVMDFKISKSQKKILRKVHRFLSVGNALDAGKSSDSLEDCGLASQPTEAIDDKHFQETATLAKTNLEDKQLDRTNVTYSSATVKKDELHTSKVSETSTKAARSEDTSPNNLCAQVKTGLGPLPNKPLCKKAKLLRMERKLEKLAKRGETLENQTKVSTNHKKENVIKTLQDYISEPLPPNAAHHLELKVVHSEKFGAESQHYYNQIYELYQKYQITIHQDTPERCSRAQFERFLVSSPLEVNTVRSWPPSAIFRLSAAETYDVYCHYQSTVHHETEADYDKEAYSEFLLESPLKPFDNVAPGHPGYGSFHQQYWLDGKLIAVGVIDILPSCVSSVYFYYDPKYGFLSLGTYGALREIAFAQQLYTIAPELRFYYMGYYIHTCEKMRYKGQFQPSFLLCPEVYTWHPIEKVRPKLEANPYSRLEERDIDDDDGKVRLEDVMVLHRRTALNFTTYDSIKLIRNLNEPEEVLEYARYVGKRCSRRTLLYRS